MARKARIEYEGAFYHVIVRGNQRQEIFKGEGDFLEYLEILSNYKKRYNFSLYSYVLMNNHVHLLIETREAPLSKILQGLNQSYTMYFNRRYRTVGHLFQGRYKAILCDRDGYLLSLIKYIHFNPVRAKVVKSPDSYRWSGHHCYVRKADREDVVETDQVLRMFSEEKSTARKLYMSYMDDGVAVKKEDIYSTVDQRVLGDEVFIEKVGERYDGELKKERRKREYTLAEIAKRIEVCCGVALENLRGRGKAEGISSGRKLFSLVAKEYGYKGKEIAKFIRRDPAVVSIAIKDRKNFEREIEDVMRLLKKSD